MDAYRRPVLAAHVGRRSEGLRTPCIRAAPVFDVSKTVTTRDSITIRWNPGSAYTDYFLVYGRRLVIARRDIPTGDFSLLASGNLTFTSYTATNLAPGSSYEFRLVGMTADNSSSSEATFTFQTASVAENAELPPGGMLFGKGGVRHVGAGVLTGRRSSLLLGRAT